MKKLLLFSSIYIFFGFKNLAQNVGIGTTTPAAPLTIFSPTTSARTQYQTNNTGQNATDGFFTGIFNLGMSAYVMNYENAPLTLGTNGTSIIKIEANGNVGIGTTSPTDKLSIENELPGFGITHTYGSVTLGTYISNSYGQFGTKTNHPLQFFTNNSNPQITLLQNGNTGIGDVAPTEKLDVSGNILTKGSLAGLRFNDRTDNTQGYQWYSNGGNAHLYRVQAPTGNVISVLENNNIGFNTSAPQADLHVNPNGPGSILIGTNKSAGGFTSLEMGISEKSGGYSYLQSTQASGSAYGRLILNPSGSDVSIAGKLGIGTNAPNSPLDIIQPIDHSSAFRIINPGSIWGMYCYDVLYFERNGTAQAGIDEDGDYLTFSDKRLKKNISEISPVLNNLLKLSVKKYQFLGAKNETKYSTGLIAQEANELFPEFVNQLKRSGKDTTTYYGINYAGFSVVAIKAIQEQQVIIENQQKKLDDFEKRLIAIETKK